MYACLANQSEIRLDVPGMFSPDCLLRVRGSRLSADNISQRRDLINPCMPTVALQQPSSNIWCPRD